MGNRMPRCRRRLAGKEIQEMTKGQTREEQLATSLDHAYKLLWLLATRKGGTLTFKPKELNALTNGGQVRMDVSDEALVLTAL